MRGMLANNKSRLTDYFSVNVREARTLTAYMTEISESWERRDVQQLDRDTGWLS